ncbi:hypothetical protein DIPPA_12104 [Diplonema papillatum]|nr:hypothetical protein DIPPA_12104 [Diplonema papillatum]
MPAAARLRGDPVACRNREGGDGEEMVIAILCEDVGMRGRYQRASGLPPASNPGGRLQRLMLQPTHADRVEEAKRKRWVTAEQLHLLGRDPAPHT